jgi:hypothetical protein
MYVGNQNTGAVPECPTCLFWVSLRSSCASLVWLAPTGGILLYLSNRPLWFLISAEDKRLTFSPDKLGAHSFMQVKHESRSALQRVFSFVLVAHSTE